MRLLAKLRKLSGGSFEDIRKQSFQTLYEYMKQIDDHTCLSQDATSKTLLVKHNGKIIIRLTDIIAEGKGGKAYLVLADGFYMELVCKISSATYMSKNELDIVWKTTQIVLQNICPNFLLSYREFQCFTPVHTQMFICEKADMTMLELLQKQKEENNKELFLNLTVQVFLALFTLHKSLKAFHNDVHLQNIMVSRVNKYEGRNWHYRIHNYQYSFKDKSMQSTDQFDVCVENMGWQAYLIDFDNAQTADDITDDFYNASANDYALDDVWMKLFTVFKLEHVRKAIQARFDRLKEYDYLKAVIAACHTEINLLDVPINTNVINSEPYNVGHLLLSRGE